jgi:hypothetical protein
VQKVIIMTCVCGILCLWDGMLDARRFLLCQAFIAGNTWLRGPSRMAFRGYDTMLAGRHRT